MSLDVRSDDTSRGHVVLLDDVPVSSDAVLTTPVLAVDNPRARPLLALHRNVWRGDTTLAADTLIAEAALTITLDRLTTAAALRRLLASVGVQAEDPALALSSLAAFEAGPADFADYFILESARRGSTRPLRTFDERLSKAGTKPV